jgi:hypothetical protein
MALKQDEKNLFFQKTPFLCLLNVKQTKIRGHFIFGGCKFNNSMTVKPVEVYRGETEGHGGILAVGLPIKSGR